MEHKSKSAKEVKRDRPSSSNDPEQLVEGHVPSSTRNEDQITGEPGCHPVGSGLGAAIGAAGVGAAAGTMTGPIGTVVGAIIGGVVGGMAGKAAAESVNPTMETAYWQEHYSTRPYYRDGQPYESYRPAYQMGWESYEGQREETWEQKEAKLKKKWEDESRWEDEGGAPSLSWEEARQAAKDSHDRVARLYNSTVDYQPKSPKHPR